MAIERLPGRGRSLSSQSRAYLDDDVLLLLDSTGYRERYRRVELRDIQALVVRRWRVFHLVTAIIGLATILPIAIGLVLRDPLPWIIGSAIPAFLLVYHLVAGRTVSVHVRTPIQLVEVRAWQRRRPARRGMARLAERVSEVQGELAPGEVVERWATVPPLPAGPVPRRSRGELDEREVGQGVHTALALLQIAEAVMTGCQWAFHSTPLDHVASILFGGEVGTALIAVAHQQQSTLPVPLKRWAVGTLLYYPAILLFGLAAGFAGDPTASRPFSIAFALAIFAIWLGIRLRLRATAPPEEAPPDAP